MNLSMVVYTLGRVLLCEGALLGLPLLVSAVYKENNGVIGFLVTMVLCLILGMVCSIRKPKNRVFYLREGFVITALSWIVISILGSLPFLLTGSMTDPISALFETVSGFTTTGASVLLDVEVLPKGVLFWRSFTHWIGGMGVLVFILMLQSPTGGSDANLMKAESPGPQVEKLVPKLQVTAKILYGIYIALTIAQIILLLLGGRSVFDAVTTAFGTAGTGGFGIKNDSIAGYSPYIQWVVTIFMILFGVNFGFYFLAFQGKLKKAFAIEEVRWYFLLILGAVVLITMNTWNLFDSVADTIRHASFQVGSIITTTGYATTDFNLWPQLSKTILVILMFAGACAGSTGGGIKISRLVVLCKTVRKEIWQFIHPTRVAKVSVGGKTVPHEVVRSINVFFATYMLIFAASVLLISLDNLDPTTSFTAVVSAINNIGPGLELVGPTGNFSCFSWFSKLVLIFDMLAGRLEIFPMLLLFKRQTWKKF